MTFTYKLGTFRFKVMPFGLMNAAVNFQRIMNEVLRRLYFFRVHMDDGIIFRIPPVLYWGSDVKDLKVSFENQIDKMLLRATVYQITWSCGGRQRY